MPGPKPKYPVELTIEKEEELRRLVRSHKTPQVKAMRARILLAAYDHPEWNNQQIAREAGTVDRVVRKWRKRWWETKSIEDMPRPGAPRHFSP
jgi:transposase-like protein